MADKISITVLSAVGAAGTLIASVFLSPSKLKWGVSGLVVAAASFGILLKHQWV